MAEFTHLDERGNAIMVDVSEKQPTKRVALAAGRISMSGECYLALKAGAVEKGDALAVARVAGILAAKRTPELIPLCHPLMITKARVEFALDDQAQAVEARCEVHCLGQTGVEMEALTGASVALLTIYDMCKALDKSMAISDLRLLSKTGGKSGEYRHD